MSSPSEDLQKAVFDLLMADAGVQAAVGGRVFDGVPSDAVHPYISFGPSDYRPADAECIAGREETLQVDVWCRDQGRKRPCRALVDRVKAALHEVEVDLQTHALVALDVTLTRVLDDPDGITAHGVVQVSALIDEDTTWS